MEVTFVVGPTASGKSSFALALALQNNGVILNCDSVQVYSHIQIGAAKPTPEELRQVPHYLYGHVTPPTEYTAGLYHRDFFHQLQVLEKQNIKHVYVVGGTGFYFQAIEKGMYDVPEISPLISQQIELEATTEDGYRALVREFQEADPELASLFHINDRYRILRALEILRATGRKPSDLKKEKEHHQKISFPYPLNKIGLDWERSQLHERIHQRVKQMLQQGLIEEVDNLNKMNLQEWVPLKSVGYKEVQEYLKGNIHSVAELEERILISTRQLAKRQITWFKRDKEILWKTMSK